MIPPGLSVFLIARDAAADLRECLDAACPIADEIVVVVDPESRDGTADVARTITPHVFLRPFDGFSSMKSFALSQCRRTWAMNLDTDERVTRQLIEEIERVKRDSDSPVSGYAVNRLPFFLGRPIRHGGWYPDWVIRLVRTDRAIYPVRAVHERLEVSGPTDRLTSPLHHFTARDWQGFLIKQRRFASLSTAAPSWVSCLTRPPATFLRSAILQMGILDGWRGLAVAYAQSYYSFHKYRPRPDPSQVRGSGPACPE